MRVHYTKDKGLIQIREVPDNAGESQYKWGVVVGPPDISELNLTKNKIKKLNNELALGWFGDYEDTKGRRSELMSIIQKVTGNRNKYLLKQILVIYQNED